jgi:hypothetical protein
MSLAWEIIAECQIHEKPFDIPLQQAKLTARKMIGGLSKERLIAIIEDRNQKQFVHFGPIGDLRTSTIFFRSFAGQEVASAEQFREVLLQLTPKETYSVTVMREGTKGYKKITCKLKAGVLQ